MSDRIDKKELVRRVSRRVGTGTGTVGEIFDATLEETYEALKHGESVSLRNFGTFLRATRAKQLGLQVQPLSAVAQALRLVVDAQGEAVNGTDQSRYCGH